MKREIPTIPSAPCSHTKRSAGSPVAAKHRRVLLPKKKLHDKSIDVTNWLGTLRLQVNLITDSIFLATPMLGPCLSDDGVQLPPKAHGALRRQRRTPRWQQDRGGPP